MSSLDQIFSILPVVLYQEIKTYAPPSSYLNFMNTSKSLFERTKFETISIQLHEQNTERYLSDKEFKAFILRMIKEPKVQLDLVYLGSQDSSNQMDLGKILTTECSKVTIGINSFTHLDPDDFHFRDFDQVEVLEGFYNTNILNINSASELRSVRPWANLRELSINFCYKLTDISGLSALRKVDINYCPALVDVSYLRDVPDLRFYECDGLTDITALENARKLTILRCKNVKASNFQSILYLDTDLLVEDSPAISSLRARSLSVYGYRSSTLQIPSLRTLKISHSKITTTAHYSNLFEISLLSSDEITHLEGLRNVPIVNVISCSNLFDISGLGENRFVKIVNCRGIQSFEPLRGVKRVDLSFCLIEDTSVFAVVEYLRLRWCLKVKELQGLMNIPHLEISRCDNLSKQFENLGNNQYFLLESDKIDELPDSLLGLFPSNRFELIQNKDSSGIHRYEFKRK